MTIDFETHTALMNLPKRYDDALCRKDAEAYGEVFTEDGVWDASPMFVVSSREKIIEQFHASFAMIDWVARVPTSTLILHYDGQHAKLRSYFLEYIKMSTDEYTGSDKPMLGIYTYVDDCVKEADGKWRIALHKLHIMVLGEAGLKDIGIIGFPVPSD